MRRILIIVFLFCCLIGLCSCVCLRETAKETVVGFLALSVKDIENAREDAIVKIVDYDYKTCYQTVEDRLNEMGSYIYARRKDLIAVYISKTDTTPAGVFFKEIDKQKTQIEISSPASDTKEFLAEKILSALSTK